MGFFDKVKTHATSISNSISDGVSKVGGDSITAGKENAKLLGLKSEISSIDGQLEIAYTQIGKRYIELLAQTGEYIDIGVSDIIKTIEPKLDKKKELEDEIIEIEKKLKDQLIMEEKEIYQREFEEEKQKLTKALKMDLLTEEEYNIKLQKAKIKLDNFDKIRKIEKQYEMEIITEEERDEALKELGVN